MVHGVGQWLRATVNRACNCHNGVHRLIDCQRISADHKVVGPRVHPVTVEELGVKIAAVTIGFVNSMPSFRM